MKEVPKMVIDGVEYPVPRPKRPFFGWKWYGSKLYARIGSLIIEAGWYKGETPAIEVKAVEWFKDVREVAVLRVQIVCAILCVSWDYGR